MARMSTMNHVDPLVSARMLDAHEARSVAGFVYELAQQTWKTGKEGALFSIEDAGALVVAIAKLAYSSVRDDSKIITSASITASKVKERAVVMVQRAEVMRVENKWSTVRIIENLRHEARAVIEGHAHVPSDGECHRSTWNVDVGEEFAVKG